MVLDAVEWIGSGHCGDWRLNSVLITLLRGKIKNDVRMTSSVNLTWPLAGRDLGFLLVTVLSISAKHSYSKVIRHMVIVFIYQTLPHQS